MSLLVRSQQLLPITLKIYLATEKMFLEFDFQKKILLDLLSFKKVYFWDTCGTIFIIIGSFGHH